MASSLPSVIKKCTLCKENVWNGGNGDERSKSLLKDFCKVVLEVSLNDLNSGKDLNLCGGCKDKVNSVLDTKKRMEGLRCKAQELEGALALELLELQGTVGVMLSQLGKINLAMMKDTSGNGELGVRKPLRKSINQTAFLKHEVAEKISYLEDWLEDRKSLVPGTCQQLTEKLDGSREIPNSANKSKIKPKIEPEVIMIDLEKDDAGNLPPANRSESMDTEIFSSDPSPGSSPSIIEVPLKSGTEVDMEEETQQRKRRRCDVVQSSAEETALGESLVLVEESSFDDNGTGKPLDRTLATFHRTKLSARQPPVILKDFSTLSIPSPDVEGQSNAYETVIIQQSKKMWRERIVKPGLCSNDLAGPTIYLNAVFNWLRVKDQKNFRLVCKQWMEETLENWRITGGTVAFRVGKSFLGEQREPIDFDRLFFEREKILFKFDAVPFHHFKILYAGELFPSNERNIQPHVDIMLRMYGPHMETLVVDISSLPLGKVLKGIKWILLEGCKNLKELSILHLFTLSTVKKEFDSDEEEPEYDQLSHAEQLQSLSICFQKSFFAGVTVKDFCSVLVNLVPNITKLSLSAAAEEEFEALGTLLKQLSVPLSTPQKFISLSDLEIDFDGDSAPNFKLQLLSKYIQTSQAHLKQIKFVFNADQVKIQAVGFPAPPLCNFLLNCKASLTNLTLEMFWEGEDLKWITELNGIQLPNLTHLTVKAKEFKTHPLPVNFDFFGLKGLPKLKVFRCVAILYGSVMFKNPVLSHKGGTLTKTELQMKRTSGFVSTELEEFSFYLGKNFNADCLRKIGTWMPSVKRLGVFANKSTFPVIFEVWKKLENLTVLQLGTIEDEMVKKMEIDYKVKIHMVPEATWKNKGMNADELFY